MEYQDELNKEKCQEIRDASCELPNEWQLVEEFAIGGLSEIGYSDDSDMLLVLSSQGRGVFDCIKGEKVARDCSLENYKSWYGQHQLIAHGFGPLEGQLISLAGIFGGGLSQYTKDGWSLEYYAIDWPDESVLLVEPNKSVLDDELICKLPVDNELKAFGFSYTGKTIVIATSSSLSIYRRV